MNILTLHSEGSSPGFEVVTVEAQDRPVRSFFGKSLVMGTYVSSGKMIPPSP
jgi:hypothetical protein